MGKRKQQDFQKTKLKVGRQLPKGGNITDTSFKTKQIITPDQSFVALADKPLTALLNYLNTKNVVQKLDTLNKIHTYIIEHKDTLSLYFPDVLTKLGNAALESDPKVPALAVKVITTCLKLLTDVQYKAFSKPMVLHLNCMMSHGALTVKRASLKVLEALLATHPKVVTKQPSILFNLLNMISSLRSKVRRLDDLVNSVVASYAWHQEVLQAAGLFLRAMAEPEDADEDSFDGGPREVYWDGKTDLYLPLYAARGPVKVDSSWYATTTKPDDGEFKKFVFQLLELLSDVVRGEIPRATRNQQDVILPASDAKYLNLIVQLLCYAGEFARQHLQLEENEVQKLTKQMSDIISLQLMNGFPYAQHGNVIPSKQRIEANEPECVQLNLGICYLSTMFILESGDAKLDSERRDVVEHLSALIKANTHLSDRSLFLYLKACRILMKSNYVNLNYKMGVMSGIYGVIEICKLTEQSKMIYSFFMDLSLDENYSEIFSSKAMANWFETLFVDLGFMADSGEINMRLLRYIKQMCCRKYPEFVQVLRDFKKKELIRLLCHDNEDFQITIIHLILTLDVIPAAFLNDLSNLICQNDAITLKMSTRLIYHLHTRYSRYGVTEKEQCLFAKFLLNTACDSRALRETATDFEDADIMDILFSILGKTTYRIYPTKKWKTHQKIFEVCLELLLPYCELKSVAICALLFARTFLGTECESIPVHVVLAFLLVRQKIGYLFRDNSVLNSSYVLMFSSFMYISVMTHEAPDQAKLYCVPELQKCLMAFLDKREVYHLIQVNDNVFRELTENEFLYALKIIMFLNIRGKIDPDDRYMNAFFRRIGNVASQSTILLPVWRKICNA